MKTFGNEKCLLISQLKDSSIEKRSTCLKQSPFEVMKVHVTFHSVETHTTLHLENELADLQNTANSETTKFIGKVSKSIQQKLKILKAYNSALFEGELNSLVSYITEFNNNTSNKFKFTSQYKVDIAIYICVDAARQIKAWVKRLKEQNDPILLLKEQRQRYFKIFENKCLKITTEKAAANQLRNSLTDAIYNTVKKRLPSKIVSHLKTKNKNFGSKITFKLQVLTDLAHAESFDHYKKYLIDSTVSFKSWADLYVEQHCSSKSSVIASSTLIELANEEVNRLITLVQNAIVVADSYGSSRWLDQFCITLCGNMEIKETEWKNDVKDVDPTAPESMKFFKMYLGKELIELQNSQKILHKINLISFELIEAASEMLFDNIMAKSCKTQCPFCKEECDNPVGDHSVHSVKFHRPQCIGRTTWLNENTLVTDVCNALVASKNYIVITENKTVQKRLAYKHYQKKYPNWNIPGESTTDPPTYWMWVVAHFYEDILSWTEGSRKTNIPDVWKRISKQEAIDSLVQPNNM